MQNQTNTYKEKALDEIFCFSCGNSIKALAEICPHCGVRQKKAPEDSSKKNRVTAALFAFFLGGLGAHRFYIGDKLGGFLYLLFFWTFIPALLALIEFIMIISTSDEKFEEKGGRMLF